MGQSKRSYLKESPGTTHVAERPRDEDGKPLKGVHYLKPERIAPRFVKKSKGEVDQSVVDLLLGNKKPAAATNVDTSILSSEAVGGRSV